MNMSELPLQQLLEHRNRHWIVSGGAIVLALTAGLPAYDELKLVHAERSNVQHEIKDVSYSIENLDLLRKRVAEAKQSSEQHKTTIDHDAGLRLREQVVAMIHAQDCRLVRVQLSAPTLTAWTPDDDPINPIEGFDDDVKAFSLEKAKLNILTEGSLTQIDKLIAELKALHPFAATTHLRLQQEGRADVLKLEIELTLFDLVINEAT